MVISRPLLIGMLMDLTAQQSRMRLTHMQLVFCAIISNRGSDYYVGMALIQHGGLHIRYRSVHPKTFAELYQMHTNERSSLFKCLTGP